MLWLLQMRETADDEESAIRDMLDRARQAAARARERAATGEQGQTSYHRMWLLLIFRSGHKKLLCQCVAPFLATFVDRVSFSWFSFSVLPCSSRRGIRPLVLCDRTPGCRFLGGPLRLCALHFSCAGFTRLHYF